MEKFQKKFSTLSLKLNSSRHAAPHLPIVFTDNIILYFNYKLFVLHLFKRSRNGTSRGWGIVTRIFLLNASIFMQVGFHHCFPRWRTEELYAIWVCKYSLPISNPNILY